jgi:flagellin FlaB
MKSCSPLKALGNLHRGEKGITGLETAIILIAFVTVAAVLAYTVLSAGIFSSERGKEAVYSGLEQAKASMHVVGNVYATGNETLGQVTAVSFQLGTTLSDENVDVGLLVMNYQDDAVYTSNISYSYTNLMSPGSNMIGPDDVADITVNMSDVGSTALVAYEDFTIEIIPSTGAAIQIKRTLPGDIIAVMNLH